MSVMLRASLILASVLTMILMMHKIRRSKVQIEDALYWVFFSFVLIVLSVFPRIAYLLSDLVGTEAPSNCIFLMVIFLLLIKIFALSVRISQLETKVKDLVQRIAIDEKDKNDE